jgi:exodeoxyribonuclease VIII
MIFVDMFDMFAEISYISSDYNEDIMKNVMIDIETLGTTPNSCILQVAAVMWDNFGRIDEGISFDLSVTEQVNLGRKIDSRTVSWWMDGKVSPEVRQSVLGRSETLRFHDGMEKLNDYIGSAYGDKGGINVWANPPQFDISIIRSAMESCSIIPVWQHWEERDLRTLRNVCKECNITFEKKNESHHSALSDAKHQAEEVIHLMKGLKFRMSLPFRGVTPVSESIYITPNTSSQE